MNCLSWDCLGLGNPEAVRELCNIAKQEGPVPLFVLETKIRAKRVEFLQKTLGFAGCFAVDSEGLSGGVGLFWSKDSSVELKKFSINHINVMVTKADQSSPDWRFTGFYGAPRVENRHHSWRFMRTLHAIPHSAWLYVGDFNATLYGSEHFSRAARLEWQMRAFREVTDECSLQDFGWAGCEYTWDNRQQGAANVTAQLDRAFANAELLHVFEESRVRHVSSIESDHCFLVVELREHLHDMNK